ncbi:MAG: MFS transporter [Acidobacteria bacterium]|nr:MFS transporter [Acidobacteriota bacterium]
MSTVVVVKKNGRVSIAADTLTSWGNMKLGAEHLTGNNKIVPVGDSFIGITGSAAHKLVIQSYFEKCKKYSFKNKLAIFETWRTMHKSLKEHYYLNVKDGDDISYETSQMEVLIANPHGIFGVPSLREVMEYEKFWAFGSGTDFALGALQCLYDRFDDAEEIARRAVETAAVFDNGTALPLTVHTVELVKSRRKK